MKKLLPTLVPFCLALLLAASPVLAAGYETLSGQWIIDANKTLAANERARKIHEAFGPDERAAMIASWQKRTLTIDFQANIVREEIVGAGNQDWPITRVEPTDAGNGVRLYFDNAESLLLVPVDADTLKFVMDPTAPMILTRLQLKRRK